MEFLLKRIDSIETRVDGIKTGRVEINSLCSTAYLRRNIFQFDERRVESLGQLTHFRVHFLYVVQTSDCLLNATHDTTIITIEAAVSLKQCSLDLLGMGQCLSLLFELFLLPFFKSGLGQLIVLETEEFLVGSCLFYLPFESIQLRFSLAITSIGRMVIIQRLAVGSNDVDHIELEIFFLQEQILVL